MTFLKEKGRIYAKDSSGLCIAEVVFREDSDGVANISHTFVSGEFAAQGVAGQLMELAYNEIKASGKKARLTCSYATSWYKKHPEKQDILAAK
jgi:predicted GNAT family acetyltransferase